jgi:superfamily II DNA or RNA helicase
MPGKNLFDFDFSTDLPHQDYFPINEGKQGRTVKEILLKDIRNSEEYLIVTGFTSLANIIDIFGANEYPTLKQLRIVIGYDPDDRVSKKLPHYSLPTEIKNYWLKQNVSIRLCGPILNLIEKIKEGKFIFRVKDRLHAKLYVGKGAAVLGSANFSKSGIITQVEANIRVQVASNEIEKGQYEAIKKIAEYYHELSDDYNKALLDLLTKLLKDASWEEALARAIAEILESRWMKDYPVLYQALVSNELWPSQKIGIAQAMKIIQDQGRVLIADPTGSGKTKFATALAYTLFHWLWENGLKDRSNALIISPKQVMDNWQKEQEHFKLYNKIESMGKLSLGHDKNQKLLQKQIESADILVVDEAHNYLHPGSKRSQAINPKGSTNVILSTATPINKKADDLLRLIELLDIDNLSDTDLTTFLLLRRNRKKTLERHQLEMLKGYINQFIVRRTKKELNRMIEREPELYKNKYHHTCKYPQTKPDIYDTGETEEDKKIADKIKELSLRLKGLHYLQIFKIPEYLTTDDDKRNYVQQRFNSAPALASFMVRSSLRSSHCALVEYLHGTDEANKVFHLSTTKSKTGNIIQKISKCSKAIPKRYFSNEFLTEGTEWLFDESKYKLACENEISIYTEINKLAKTLSGRRERKKAAVLVEKAVQYNKVIAFDSTVISLDYFKKIIDESEAGVKVLVATGQNNKNRSLVKEYLSLGSENNEKLIALCSDAMSEGINLPDAKALVLLDMPSVLRVIEQRIGRLERMDSEHKEIHIFWPNDSDEFSLKGDKRMVDILLVTENLIGNNVDIPKAIYDRHLKDGLTTENIIKAYDDYSNNEHEWTGVKDSTQNLYSLIEGKHALIDTKIYNEFKDVDSTVKTAVSFIECDKNWSFFAFRGSTTRSPKWLFIDDRNKAFTDFAEIAAKLKEYLNPKEIIQRRWNDVDTGNEIKKIVWKLRQQEKELLPWKKKRALFVGQRILKQMLDALPKNQHGNGNLISSVLHLFNQNTEAEEFIDYDHFSELWLSLLIPVLDKLRNTRKRKRTIITLRDLTVKDVKLTNENLEWLLENCRYANTLDEIIAACIIGIAKQ